MKFLTSFILDGPLDRFASRLPGWRTDRGHVYITNGPPDEIQAHPGGDGSNPPFEIWSYRHMEGIGATNLRFVDAARDGT